MEGLPLPRGSESQKIHERMCVIVEECIENNMTKDETLRHVQNKYLIPHERTNRVWAHLERTKPDLFISYNARIRERNALAELLQRILDTLGQVLNALGQLQSNSDYIMKQLTDGHEFGPHPFAVGSSSKRQRVGEAEVRGGNEETEKLEEKQRGNRRKRKVTMKKQRSSSDQNLQLQQ